MKKILQHLMPIFFLPFVIIIAFFVTSYADTTNTTENPDNATRVEADAVLNMDYIPQEEDNLYDTETNPILRADTTHYKVLKNKTYKGNRTRVIKWKTTAWAKASKYVLKSGTSVSASFSVSATSGSFPSSDVKKAGNFQGSISKTWSTETHIPANKTEYSKLALKARDKMYTGTLYSVIDFGTKKTETKLGTGKIY